MKYSITSLVALVCILYTIADDVNAACGYKACPSLKSNMINVHLVPHSHDDVGWLKTVDQYYYGSKTNIQHAGVQYILENVVKELMMDKRRRFIYVESAFFLKWRNEQTKAVQKQVQKLVEEGRLVFAGGAWSMNDEGAVHYQSVIDQFSLGLKALSDAFGPCGRPTVGWQIDPFGHSREQASLFAQMGFDGEFFARVDWVEKSERFKNLTSEMIWKASADLGGSSELFTGILLNHYSAPPGFCFDQLCSDAPIIDGNSYDNNVDQKVDAFLSYIHNMTKKYRSSSNLLVPMGDDFNYENAAMNFKNMDKLIKYVNDRQKRGSKVNLVYSTPACYLNALHESEMLTWPTKTEDFFPYSSDWHSYWTGYYSSRPTQKRFERLGNHFLQVVKQLAVLTNLTSSITSDNLNKLRQAMGVMQHHDAITGTEKQHVAYDYDRLLTDALSAAQSTAQEALQKLTNRKDSEFVSCLQLNISVCEFSQRNAANLAVTLFNPLAHIATQYVRVPVKFDTYTVTDESGRVVPSQLVPLPKEVLALPFRPNSSQHELVFKASVVKVANYYVSSKPKPRVLEEELETNRISLPKRFQRQAENYGPTSKAANEAVVGFGNVKLAFSKSSGRLVRVEMNNVVEHINQEFFYYRGAAGNNMEFKNRSSGAYIFRPNGTEVLISEKATLTIVEGPLVKEVHQRFNDWISQVIRIYEGINRVEFEWLVGSIPVKDNVGKEVIMRFTSNIRNNGIFWTDSNGREMMRRVRNEREYFKPNMTEQVSGNYYPITARMAIEDNQKRLALLNDRAQGGTSIRSGSLELMLHRRLLRDDAFGVGEALNETVFGKGLVARGKIYLMLGASAKKPSVDERIAQQEIHLPLWTFFSNFSKSNKPFVPKLPDFSSLPPSVQLLSLEPFSDKERLLRLEHFMNRNESKTVEFNLRPIFDGLGGEEITETTLDGSMPLDKMKRFKFTPDGEKLSAKRQYHTSKHVPLYARKKDARNKFVVKFEPMQIRTFNIKWK